jgi:hypothetical protein
MRSEVPRSSLGVASSAASPRSSSSWGVRGGRWPLLSAELGANEVESLERSVVMSSCTCACGIMLLLAMTAVGVCEDHGHRIFLPVARERSASAGAPPAVWCSPLDRASLASGKSVTETPSLGTAEQTRVLKDGHEAARTHGTCISPLTAARSRHPRAGGPPSAVAAAAAAPKPRSSSPAASPRSLRRTCSCRRRPRAAHDG